MKKLLYLFILLLASFSKADAVCPMWSPNVSACMVYDPVSGNVQLKITHGATPPYYPDCAYMNYYQSPFTTWAYVKDPSSSGFFGPFIVTANIPPDPTTGVAYTLYDVSIPGFSGQQCYDVYLISNRTWYYSDPTNSWGFSPSPTLDPSGPYNIFSAPNGNNYQIYSTQIPYSACLCEGSPSPEPCNVGFRLNLNLHTDYYAPSTGGLGSAYIDGASVELLYPHTGSTYTYEWDGVVATPGWFPPAYAHYYRPLSGGTHKVCVTEHTTLGTSCKKCMTFCLPTVTDEIPDGGEGIMIKSQGAEPKTLLHKATIYPNPTDKSFSLEFDSNNEGSTEIVLSELTGRIVETFQKPVQKGKNKINLTLTSISSGVYMVNINGVAGKFNEILTIQK